MRKVFRVPPYHVRGSLPPWSTTAREGNEWKSCWSWHLVQRWAVNVSKVMQNSPSVIVALVVIFCALLVDSLPNQNAEKSLSISSKISGSSIIESANRVSRVKRQLIQWNRRRSPCGRRRRVKRQFFPAPFPTFPFSPPNFFNPFSGGPLGALFNSLLNTLSYSSPQYGQSYSSPQYYPSYVIDCYYYY